MFGGQGQLGAAPAHVEVDRTVLARLINDKEGTGLPDQAFTEPTILICEELTPTLSEGGGVQTLLLDF